MGMGGAEGTIGGLMMRVVLAVIALRGAGLSQMTNFWWCLLSIVCIVRGGHVVGGGYSANNTFIQHIQTTDTNNTYVNMVCILT